MAKSWSEWARTFIGGGTQPKVTNTSPNIFELLSLDKMAGRTEVKKAYRMAMRTSHPDKLVNLPEGTEKEQKVEFGKSLLISTTMDPFHHHLMDPLH